MSSAAALSWFARHEIRLAWREWLAMMTGGRRKRTRAVIGLVVFAAIIPVAPATGASINPARTIGPMLVQQLAGGTVKWEQLPVYLLAELAAGALAGLTFGAISRTRADAVTAAATESPVSAGV